MRKHDIPDEWRGKLEKQPRTVASIIQHAEGSEWPNNLGKHRYSPRSGEIYLCTRNEKGLRLAPSDRPNEFLDGAATRIPLLMPS